MQTGRGIPRPLQAARSPRKPSFASLPFQHVRERALAKCDRPEPRKFIKAEPPKKSTKRAEIRRAPACCSEPVTLDGASSRAYEAIRKQDRLVRVGPEKKRQQEQARKADDYSEQPNEALKQDHEIPCDRVHSRTSGERVVSAAAAGRRLHAEVSQQRGHTTPLAFARGNRSRPDDKHRRNQRHEHRECCPQRERDGAKS